MEARNNVENEDGSYEYGDCNTCVHQNEICTNCMSKNTAGEWVHSHYSPMAGTYRMPGQKTYTTTTITDVGY